VFRVTNNRNYFEDHARGADLILRAWCINRMLQYLHAELLFLPRKFWVCVLVGFYRASAYCCWRAILAILSVRLSVCLSVCDTLVLYENGLTYRHIFSPYFSPIILVLPASNIFTKFRSPPTGALNKGGVWKCRNFRPITCYISEMVEDIWVYTARRLTNIESCFHSCNIYRDCPRDVSRGGQNLQKMC